jgi:hypothetical protein
LNVRATRDGPNSSLLSRSEPWSMDFMVDCSRAPAITDNIGTPTTS